MKTKMMETLGEQGLTLPSQVEAGLAANDRLKYYFSLLQVARDHADQPEQSSPSLRPERLVAGVVDATLDQLVAATRKEGASYHLPGCGQLLTSIADDATVLILGNNGYEPATKGRNGFVCLVWRSWEAGLNDPEFWNPRIRSPLCLNAAAARSILPASLERTKWALAGLSRKNIGDRIKAAVAANTFAMPAPGAMAFMMSKTQYLGDAAGHWHPHVMFFVAHTEGGDWGADLAGSPVFAGQGDPEPTTTFFVPVTQWSDGTASVMEKH